MRSPDNSFGGGLWSLLFFALFVHSSPKVSKTQRYAATTDKALHNYPATHYAPFRQRNRRDLDGQSDRAAKVFAALAKIPMV